jgi:hypothetical protein
MTTRERSVLPNKPMKLAVAFGTRSLRAVALYVLAGRNRYQLPASR